MAKKKKISKMKRSALIQISVSQDEREDVFRAATDEGKTASEYLRDLHEAERQSPRKKIAAEVGKKLEAVYVKLLAAMQGQVELEKKLTAAYEESSQKSERITELLVERAELKERLANFAAERGSDEVRRELLEILRGPASSAAETEQKPVRGRKPRSA